MKTTEALVKLDKKASDGAISLSDGTKLWLKPGSHFRYESDFNVEDRVVYLHGEMFIHVAPNQAKPFVINMEKNSLRVLGTSFYIKSDKSEKLELKVEEGMVEISGNKDAKEILKAGEEIRYDKVNDTFEANSDQNPLVSNWRKNYLVFENVPLMNVFDKLSIFYGVQFSINCPAIQSMDGFTSLVQQDDNPKLHSFIRTLEKVYGIEVDEIGPKEFKVHGDLCK